MNLEITKLEFPKAAPLPWRNDGSPQPMASSPRPSRAVPAAIAGYCSSAAPFLSDSPLGAGRGEEASLVLVPAAGRRFGFTLIELLIVISIIAILAGLLLTATGTAKRSRIKSRARTELNLVQMAIENYKSKLGHYPPDNPGLPSTNQLYFELLGTTNLGTGFATLDGSARIQTSEFQAAFGNNPGVTGFVNSSGRGGGDEARMARSFLQDLKPSQIGVIPPRDQVKYLLCSVRWEGINPATFPLGSEPELRALNPFRYVSSNPTNNPGSFDLWVDIVVGGKVNRICNWSKEPIIVGTP